jgi:hypothetical protein
VPSSKSRSKDLNIEYLKTINYVIYECTLDSNINIGSDEGSNSYFRSIGNDDFLMKEDEQM